MGELQFGEAGDDTFLGVTLLTVTNEEPSGL